MQDSFERAADDSMTAALARRRGEVTVTVGGDSLWFEAHRPLDVSGDGRPDELFIRAKGSRSDSLTIRMSAVVGRDTLLLAEWNSSYELVDPPFPRDTALAVVDTFIRSRLVEVLAGVDVSMDRITKQSFDADAGDPCDEELAVCLRRKWGLSTIDGHDVATEILAGPVPVVAFGYGYETAVSIAWVASIRRFVGLSACC